MPLIVTPGQLSQRAEFYHQLAQLTAAGVGLTQALEMLVRRPPARSYREPIRQVLQELGQGSTFAESLEHAGRWLPEFDVSLLNAGEQSGRLDACFRLLSDYYRDRARMARQVLADLAYPLFLFHFALILFPFPQLYLTGNWVLYLTQIGVVLVPLYTITFLLLYAAQGRHGETWRALVETFLRPVPVLGNARHSLALARLAASLEALLSAGVTIIEAWQLAAAASGSPRLRREVSAWKRGLDSGETPAELLNNSTAFPELFTNQYMSAEVSGKLDETLRRLCDYYQEEGSRKLHAVAQWVPRFVYLIVALAIAWRIVHFWTGHFQQINAITGGF